MTKTYSLNTNGATKRKARNDKKINKKGRRPYTTMLRPELRETLHAVAFKDQKNVSDVLEVIICEYFDLTLVKTSV